MVSTSSSVCDWYLLQLIILSIQDFNCYNNFVLPCIDKVITVAKSVLSVISNSVAPVVEEITRFSYQAIMTSIHNELKHLH